MKVLVLSDSHGRIGAVIDAYTLENCSDVIFLGDGLSDMRELEYAFPEANLRLVRGNCDFFSSVTDGFLSSFEGVSVFACHGHTYGVKNGISRLAHEGKSKNAQAVLYGHTHIQDISSVDGVTLINPGAISRGYYAVLTFENGSFNCELKTL